MCDRNRYVHGWISINELHYTLPDSNNNKLLNRNRKFPVDCFGLSDDLNTTPPTTFRPPMTARSSVNAAQLRPPGTRTGPEISSTVFSVQNVWERYGEMSNVIKESGMRNIHIYTSLKTGQRLAQMVNIIDQYFFISLLLIILARQIAKGKLTLACLLEGNVSYKCNHHSQHSVPTIIIVFLYQWSCRSPLDRQLMRHVSSTRICSLEGCGYWTLYNVFPVPLGFLFSHLVILYYRMS